MLSRSGCASDTDVLITLWITLVAAKWCGMCGELIVLQVVALIFSTDVTKSKRLTKPRIFEIMFPYKWNKFPNCSLGLFINNARLGRETAISLQICVNKSSLLRSLLLIIHSVINPAGDLVWWVTN